MRQIYLDNAGSTKVLSEVLESFNQVAKSYYANPSANHDLGNNNNRLYKEARKQIASLCVVKDEEVFFTSGASESINTAIKGTALYHMKRGKHIVTTTLEHAATNETLIYLQERFGFEVTYVEPINGEITAEMITDVTREDTILVTMSHVHSETGMILAVEDIAKSLQIKGIIMHVDACQSFGKIPLDIKNIDLVSVSFHKMHGIKGSGMLIKKKHVMIDSLIHGGNQQSLRSGTIPLELVVCGAKTLRIALESRDVNYGQVLDLWNYTVDNLKDIEGVVVNSTLPNSPYVLNFSIRDINISAFSRLMWQKGIYIAAKTSCASSDSYSKSIYSITSDMELASNSLRISFSKFTTIAEIETFLEALKVAIEMVRKNNCG